MFDVCIIGAGPAGMSAAIYACRAGLRTAVFEKAVCGGQMVNTPEVANYPGIAMTSGATLSESMRAQMLALGAALYTEEVLSVSGETPLSLKTASNEYTSQTLILANGAERRKLGVPGEERLMYRGVSFCAVCDGMFFRGKRVAVVGGGNTALEDALYLSGICEKVYLIHRRDTFTAQKVFADRVLSAKNIEILYNTTVTEILGEKKTEALSLKTADGDRKIDVAAVFIAVGLVPDNARFRGLVPLDSSGYIEAGEDTRTARRGVFAAGDTRSKTLRQIVTAASDGARAAVEAEKYVRGLGASRNFLPRQPRS